MNFLGESKCSVCGRIFFYTSADDWAYKRMDNRHGKMKYFCSWTCLRIWEKKHENHKPKRKI